MPIRNAATPWNDAAPEAMLPDQGAPVNPPALGSMAAMEPGPSPVEGAGVVQALRQGAANLMPEEIQLLRDAITPDVAMVLTKMLGPEFGEYIAPFTSTTQDQQMLEMAAMEQEMAMGGGMEGGGAPGMPPVQGPLGGVFA